MTAVFALFEKWLLLGIHEIMKYSAFLFHPELIKMIENTIFNTLVLLDSNTYIYWQKHLTVYVTVVICTKYIAQTDLCTQ